MGSSTSQLTKASLYMISFDFYISSRGLPEKYHHPHSTHMVHFLVRRPKLHDKSTVTQPFSVRTRMEAQVFCIVKILWMRQVDEIHNKISCSILCSEALVYILISFLDPGPLLCYHSPWWKHRWNGVMWRAGGSWSLGAASKTGFGGQNWCCCETHV